MSTSGCVATCRQSSVLSTGPSASGSSRVSASRLDTHLHAQTETELERDLLGILSQNRHRSGADVAETDNANVHIIHKWL